MELFEEIRREYASGETILGLAKKHGVHRPSAVLVDDIAQESRGGDLREGS